ncbi:MAG TPA: hypothetical protein VHL79_00315 [Ramlibacter sp.]|jgi:hypothetical protein|nr:hypothetical protein [Ramlibacter sp.]
MTAPAIAVHALAARTRVWARSLRTSGHPVLSLALGVALGLLAWGEGRVPVPALSLPLLVGLSRSRAQAFWLAFGYAAGVLRHAAAFIASWFGDHLVVGMAAVVAYAVIAGAVWACGWSASPRIATRMGTMAAAWLLALGLALAVPGHPLVAAGFVLPDSGWAGALAACLLGPAALAVLTTLRPRARAGMMALLLASLAAAGVALHREPTTGALAGIAPRTTAWGALRSPDDVLQRLQHMARAPLALTDTTVVWPESILGRYEPSFEPVLQLELLQPARAAGRTLVIGMDLPLPGERLASAAVVFHPDERRVVALARQPAPLALWKPWRQEHTFVADWRAGNMLELGQGERAAVIFCYEEYMPLLYLLNEAFDAPTLYLALANTWAARDPAAATIQTWHSLGMARLFGRPYLKAENHAAP